MSRFHRILHATDFSSASRAALTRAIELARKDRARLTLLHVMNPVVPWAGEGYVTAAVYEQVIESTRTQAQKRLDRLIKKAGAAGVRAKALLVEGVPHDRIVRTARSQRADLLVIGTHGHTGLARLFLGSVAARVLALAPCPVLTIRGR